MQIFVSKM